MTLLRFDPAREFERLQKKMGEFTEDMEKGINFEFGGFSPRIDISEDENSVFIHAEMPGMAKEDVKVSVNEENLLTIKGNKKKPDGVDEQEFIRSERIFGEFSRSFVMPENVDRDSIMAKFENGLLAITFSKKEPEKPKEIHVEIS